MGLRRKKQKNSGEYTGSTPAFSATYHAAQRKVRVCMLITFSKSKDQPGKVASPARGQLNREIGYFLSSFAPENLVSQDRFVPKYHTWYQCSL